MLICGVAWSCKKYFYLIKNREFIFKLVLNFFPIVVLLSSLFYSILMHLFTRADQSWLLTSITEMHVKYFMDHVSTIQVSSIVNQVVAILAKNFETKWNYHQQSTSIINYLFCRTHLIDQWKHFLYRHSFEFYCYLNNEIK